MHSTHQRVLSIFPPFLGHFHVDFDETFECSEFHYNIVFMLGALLCSVFVESKKTILRTKDISLNSPLRYFHSSSTKKATPSSPLTLQYLLNLAAFPFPVNLLRKISKGVRDNSWYLGFVLYSIPFSIPPSSHLNSEYPLNSTNSSPSTCLYRK